MPGSSSYNRQGEINDTAQRFTYVTGCMFARSYWLEYDRT